MRAPLTDRATPSVLAGIAGVIAIAVLVPGLGDHGIWSDGELPIFDRSRAALGDALSGLTRSPWLPDALRTASYDAIGGAAGLRLPHALSGAALVALTTWVARWRGASVPIALLAGALALSFPIVGLTSRTALGNPIGELAAALAIVGGLIAIERRSALWTVVTLAAIGLAASASGLALGVAIPLATVAAVTASPPPASDGTTPAATPRWVALLLVGGAFVAIGVTVMLSLRQGDGYLPILGAAKNLELIDKPELRRFAAGFEDFGYHLFPWTPLVLVGALVSDRDRLGPAWLSCAVAGAAAWSVAYGTVPTPVVVPAALCGAAAIERAVRRDTLPVWRRVALAAILGGMLVLGKDADLAPERIAAPLLDYPGGRGFPAEALHAAERLKQLRSFAAIAVLLAALSAARNGWIGRVMARVPDVQRPAWAAALVGAAALSCGFLFARPIITDLSILISPRTVLERYDGWVQRGELPEALGAHRVRDPAMALYGPGNIEALASRRDVTMWLSGTEPAVALIRDRDLAPIHMTHRHQDFPLFVLDRSHASLMLVANVLPEGVEDQNPIPAVLSDAPPELAHETMLRFENYIEVIGWQATDPIVRGRPASIEVAIKVLRPLPGGCKLYTRLLKGRSSRMFVEPQPFTDDVYPPNLWREGDYILHRVEFDAPPIEIVPGEHELILGLRRSEQENLAITIPEGKTGEFGVSIRGSKRNFAAIGSVQVW